MASGFPLMGRSNMSTYPPGREERSQRRQRRVATAARASTTATPPVKQCQTNLDRPQPRPQSRCSRWTFHLSVLLSHAACPPRASRPSPPHQEGHHPPATRLEDMRSPCLGERHHSATILGEWHHPATNSSRQGVGQDQALVQAGRQVALGVASAIVRVTKPTWNLERRQQQPAARTDVSEEVKYYSKLHQRARRRPSSNPSSSTSSNCTRCSTYVNDPDSSPRRGNASRAH